MLEFGIINSLRSGNIIIDSILCICISVLFQQSTVWFKNIIDFLYKGCIHMGIHREYVIRSIEASQFSNQCGFIINNSHNKHNDLLHKAILNYFADNLEFENKLAAQYDLIENSNPSLINNCNTNDLKNKSSCKNIIETLNVGLLPPLNKWVKIESNIWFMHETNRSARRDSEKTHIQESKIIFHFKSKHANAAKIIDDLINSALEKYKNKERQRIYNDNHRYMYIRNCEIKKKTEPFRVNKPIHDISYKRYILGEEKTFDTLFFNDKEQILQLLDNFIYRKDKFAIKGFPYKLGLLLHGPPGTGKTSLIKAIAQYTKRHIVTISLDKIKTNQELVNMMFDLKFPIQELDLPVNLDFNDIVFVMEDIDCVSSIVMSRTNKSNIVKENKPDKEKKESLLDDLDSTKKPDNLNLSGLLNVLDGVIDCPGRIIIMTTNHPEKLDSALIRPGRINKKLLLGYMNSTQIQNMVEYYFMTKFTQKQHNKLTTTIFETNTGSLSKELTPAEIEELCAECKNIDEVLTKLKVITEDI